MRFRRKDSINSHFPFSILFFAELFESTDSHSAEGSKMIRLYAMTGAENGRQHFFRSIVG